MLELPQESVGLVVLAVMCLALGFLLCQFRGKVLWRFIRAVLVLGLMLVALVSLAITFSIQGYRSLTREQLAATVQIEQLGEQVFRASVNEHDGSESETFDLAGDQLYVDARVLKWHPWANVLGLQTLFELERISGRYASLDDEQTSARTVYSLAQKRPLDLFELATQYARYTPFVDAEYGSGVFLEVEDGGVYTLNISNSGLVLRQD